MTEKTWGKNSPYLNLKKLLMLMLISKDDVGVFRVGRNWWLTVSSARRWCSTSSRSLPLWHPWVWKKMEPFLRREKVRVWVKIEAWMLKKGGRGRERCDFWWIFCVFWWNFWRGWRWWNLERESLRMSMEESGGEEKGKADFKTAVQRPVRVSH